MKSLQQLLTGLCLLIGSTSVAQAGLIVEQYDDYWSTDVNQLIAYAANNVADATGMYNIIDFTDDPNGFAGDIPGSMRWPSAEAADADGNRHSLNQTFFARIYGFFYVANAGEYFFRTFNDDGVFVFVDNDLVINDPTLHPERSFFGSKQLNAGRHFVELFFFENGGEASLEFTVSDDIVNFTHFLTSDSSFSAVPTPMTLSLFLLIALPFFWRFSKRES